MPRLQFTLRALLVAMLVVAAFFGGLQVGERREKNRRDREEQTEAKRLMAEAWQVLTKRRATMKRRSEEVKAKLLLDMPPPSMPTSPKKRLIKSTFDKVDSPRQSSIQPA